MNMQIFREMADVLARRQKTDITILFNKTDGGREVIHARYDALFQAVELGNATVPARELRQWLRLLYGADGETIKITY